MVPNWLIGVSFSTPKLWAVHCFRLHSKLRGVTWGFQVNPESSPASSGCFGRRPFPGSRPGRPPSAGDPPAGPPLHLQPSAAAKTTGVKGEHSRSPSRMVRRFTVCVAASTATTASTPWVLPSEASCRSSLPGCSTGASSSSGVAVLRAPSSASWNTISSIALEQQQWMFPGSVICPGEIINYKYHYSRSRWSELKQQSSEADNEPGVGCSPCPGWTQPCRTGHQLKISSTAMSRRHMSSLITTVMDYKHKPHL